MSFSSRLSALKSKADRALRQAASLFGLASGAARLPSGRPQTPKQRSTARAKAENAIGKAIAILTGRSRKTTSTGVSKDREAQAIAEVLAAAGMPVVKPGATSHIFTHDWDDGAGQSFPAPAKPNPKPPPDFQEWDTDSGQSFPPPKPTEFESAIGDAPAKLRMIRVQSSNVHSIGYDDVTETLYIRYLGTVGDRRAGPGALYEYRDVPISVWDRFVFASSKGGFVWDEIRVRGTVSGHRYSYEFIGTGPRGYIPRRAGLKRGESGEFYMRRKFKGRESGLPERRVHARGPNPQRGPGANKLILKKGRQSRRA